jgi:hypothetical protein
VTTDEHFRAPRRKDEAEYTVWVGEGVGRSVGPAGTPNAKASDDDQNEVGEGVEGYSKGRIQRPVAIL